MISSEDILNSTKDGEDFLHETDDFVTPQKSKGSLKISKDRPKSSQIKKEKYSIHEASERGNSELIRELIKKKKTIVNLRNESGHIPIHLAALHNCYEVVELLIKNGSDLNAQDNSGWSTLHFAASGRNEKILKLLLEQPDIDVNAVNEGMNTPLHYIAKNFSMVSQSLIEAFKRKGANINAKNSQGETPLHGAALMNHYVVIERLIECGADVDIVNNDGETALNWATKSVNEKSISVLLRTHSTNLRHRKTVVSVPSFLKTPVTKVDPHHRYELTFLGTDTEVILDDDNWDVCLYDGGIQLENKAQVIQVSENPHYNSISKEDLPLSKLFNLYLSISGRNKTDPEIVYWIADFLAGPKRKYLLYLCENYSYRIRVKNSMTPDSKKMDKLKKYESIKKTYLDIWEEVSDSDNELWKRVFEQEDYVQHIKGGSEMKKRIISLVEHRKLSLQWEIHPSKIDILSKLGEGSFGIVYKGQWMGVEVAVKKISMDTIGIEEYHSFLNEIVMMSNLRHPNIVMFLGGCIRPPNLCYVTEFLVLGSLDNVLKIYPKLDWKVRLNMAIESARGLAYLHNQSPPILHRDLKSLNILVNKNFHIKVSDFGLSVEKSNNLNSKMGTLNWLAPELINGSVDVYSESADIYSFGMVLWEIVSGRVPYEGKSQLQILRMIDMHEMETIPEGTNSRYADIIRSCWMSDPAKRPSINEILEKLEDIKILGEMKK